VARNDGSYFREQVLFYQDGMNFHHAGKPIPDCLSCDDSYDLGERGVSYRSAPFWARLGLTPPASGRNEDWVDLNTQEFPTDFLLPSQGNIPTPAVQGKAGEPLRVHVLDPAGRARQRTFTLLGHNYAELPPLPRFGAPGAVLLAPGKAITADLENTDPDKTGAVPGTWIYRDGPANMFSSGVWGSVLIKEK